MSALTITAASPEFQNWADKSRNQDDAHLIAGIESADTAANYLFSAFSGYGSDEGDGDLSVASITFTLGSAPSRFNSVTISLNASGTNPAGVASSIASIQLFVDGVPQAMKSVFAIFTGDNLDWSAMPAQYQWSGNWTSVNALTLQITYEADGSDVGQGNFAQFSAEAALKNAARSGPLSLGLGLGL